MSLIAARVPLTAASYRRCRDELRPGQVKRVSAGPRRVLVGYVVACPACGVARPHLGDEVGFVEDAAGLVCSLVPMPCVCGLLLRVVRDPAPALEAYVA